MTRIMIVGGGSEIGRAIVQALYESGKVSELLLIGRSGTSMDRAYTDNCLTFGSDKCKSIECDFIDPELTASTVRRAVIEFRPSISVLAAGINLLNPSSEEKARMGFVNFLSMSAAGEEILLQNELPTKSSLIVLSSIASIRPRPTNYIYGATKVGLDFWARGAMAKYSTSTEIILIRLGKVSTTSSLGHPWAPFTRTPIYVGSRVAKLVGRGTRTVWVPKLLGVVATILRVIPVKLWIRLSLSQANQ